MLKRAIDVGRSRTRICNSVNDVTGFDSEYKKIQKDEAKRTDGGDLQNDFEIVEAPNTDILGRYVRGDTAAYHKAEFTQADNQLKKYQQNETFVNIVFAVASDLAMSEDLNDMGETIELGVCIPCGEFFSNGGDLMKQKLAGMYEVDFPLLDKKVCFEIEEASIRVAPEGVIAVYSLPKDERLKVTKGKTVMVIDGGRGSLDITLLRNGLPLGDTSRSFTVGGVTLESFISSELEVAGYFASASNVQDALVHNRIMQGNEEKNVKEIVDRSKSRLADGIINCMKQVVIQAMIAEGEINSICPVGRLFTREEDGTSIVDLISDRWNYGVDVIDVSNPDYGLEAANVLGVASLM